MNDRKPFYDGVRASLFGGALTAEQVAGMDGILDAFEKWTPTDDPRFLAYELATAYHETGARMCANVEEIGRGKGHAYGKPAGPAEQIYYGRGPSQITWLDNYEKFDARLHQIGVLDADESIVTTPDLALQPRVAFPILSIGMKEGRFTQRKLSDYFNAHGSDWVNARRIINGLDKAQLIAGYGRAFYAALTPPAPRAA